MNIGQIKYYYFLGIGGIGMSALARYFHALGKNVSGYDKTPSEITDALQSEGIEIHFDDNPGKINAHVLQNPDESLVVRTPAVPVDTALYQFLANAPCPIKKRAEVLGMISKSKKTLAVAGTHGKTSVTTMLAWLLSHTAEKCNAFLGGISKNFGSNLVLEPSSPYVVVEADEYDRSFLQLEPASAIITAMDSDHLDIYSHHSAVEDAYRDFAAKISTKGFLVVHQNYAHIVHHPNKISYAVGSEKAMYKAVNLRMQNHAYHFDVHTPNAVYEGFEMQYPGRVNVENALAALALLHANGFELEELKLALKLFQGVRRRFDYQVKTSQLVYIDDYAHHPRELEAFIGSVKELYPDIPITGVFQPHLFSRTRDFAEGFAHELDKLDMPVLLDIYPAREKPIEGISSYSILAIMKNKNKKILTKDELLDFASKEGHGVFLTMGAGDIDRLVKPLKNKFLENIKNKATA